MITTSGFDAFFWAFHAEVNFKLFKLSLKDFSFPVRLQTILTEILIIKLCLWSYQQMVEQDLPLVSYGFLTGFRGISDPAAPCTFNTGFRLTRSQVGRVGPLPATHFAKMKGKPNRVWIRKLYLCMIFVSSGKLVWLKYIMIYLADVDVSVDELSFHSELYAKMLIKHDLLFSFAHSLLLNLP